MRYTSEEIQHYPPKIQEHIKKGEIAPLMTTKQVRYAWGSPISIRVVGSTDDGKEISDWTYKRMGGLFSTTLTFIDGKLREIVTNDPGTNETIIKER